MSEEHKKLTESIKRMKEMRKRIRKVAGKEETEEEKRSEKSI